MPKETFEVIAVDDDSPDGDTKAARFQTARWPFAFQYLRQPKRGPASARNLGLKHARAPTIAFTDDDAIPESHWLEELVSTLNRDRDICGVAGKTVAFREKTLTERYLAHSQHLSAHQYGPDGDLVYLITVNAAFRRGVLDEVGGFDEAFPFASGEDMDLGFRIRQRGYRFGVSERAVVRHRQRETIRLLWRTWFVYGRGSYLCAARNPGMGTTGIASEKLVEPRKVFDVVKRLAGRMRSNLRTPEIRRSDAITFPVLELSNHCAYQAGRLYAWLRDPTPPLNDSAG